MTWPEGTPGVLELPSGLRVRGRGVRRPLPAGPEPQFAVHVLGRTPPAVPWESRWVRWPDWGLPLRPSRLRAALEELRRRGRTERVEVACAGGRGRTGTSLACLAVLEGVPAREAVAYVRRNYDAHAVETPWQRLFVRWFAVRTPRAGAGRPRGCASTPRDRPASATRGASTRGNRGSAAR